MSGIHIAGNTVLASAPGPTVTYQTAGDPLPSIFIDTVLSFASPAFVFYELRVNGDEFLTRSGNGGDTAAELLGSWILPASAAPNGIFVRFTPVLGLPGSGSSAANTWLEINTTRSQGVNILQQSPTINEEYRFFFELATDAAGSNIVYTSPQKTLIAGDPV